MATTTLSDAYATPLDEGIGSVADGEERRNSAAYEAALSEYQGGAYRLPGSFAFVDGSVDTANDQVDIAAGRAYVTLSGAQAQSGRGSSSSTTHDITLSEPVPIAIDLVSGVTNFDLEAGTNDVYLALDTDGTTTGTAGDVYIAYGTSIAAPSEPSLYLGQVDTSAGTSTPAGRFDGRGEVAFAEPGELQAVINAVEADGGGLVKLYSNRTYDPAAEVHVKPGVRLDCNGATFLLTSDIDYFFLDNNTRLYNLYAQLDSGLTLSNTNAVITLDSSRASDPYRAFIGSAAKVHNATIFGNSNDSGTALRLTAGNSQSITIGTQFTDLKIGRMGHGIHFDCGDSAATEFVAADFSGLAIAGCVKQIRQTGTAGHAVSTIFGTLQCGATVTDNVIINEGSVDFSVNFFGTLFDAQQANATPLVGGGINCLLLPKASDYGLDTLTDGSTNQFVAVMGNPFRSAFEFVGESGNVHHFDGQKSNRLEYRMDGTELFHIGDNGGFAPVEQDLSGVAVDAYHDKEIYLHDGANSITADGGTTSAAGYYAWDDTNSEWTAIRQF